MAQAPSFAPSPNQFTPALGRGRNDETEFAGSTITIAGAGFNVGQASVKFGDVEAEILARSPSRLQVSVPSVEPGPMKITVTTAGGTVTSTDTFEALPFPRIFEMEPFGFGRDPSNEDLTMTITGVGFVPLGGGSIFVTCHLAPRFGDQHEQQGGTFTMPVLSVTPTQIIVQVPPIPEFGRFIPGTGTVTLEFSDSALVESDHWVMEGL